jgi:hypothetical protein
MTDNMRTFIIILAAVTMAGCTTIEQDAARACGGHNSPPTWREHCQQQYLAREQARIDNENAMLGAIIVGNGGFYRPAPAPIFVGCTSNRLMTNCIAQ